MDKKKVLLVFGLTIILAISLLIINIPSLVRYDSDGDGLSDEQETKLGTNPMEYDTDKDGLDDRNELTIFGSDPTLFDTDGDKLSDRQEQVYGTNPLSQDTDKDGLSDHYEVFITHSNPLLADHRIMLTLIDDVTNSRVHNEKVYIDSIYVGYTDNEGTISLEGMTLGQFQVSVEGSGRLLVDVGELSVGKDTKNVFLSVDMPNPEFSLSLQVSRLMEGMVLPKKGGKATLTIRNIGNRASENTLAVVTVYDTAAERVTLYEVWEFETIPVGETRKGETGILYTNKMYTPSYTSHVDEDLVFVVVYDGSDYLPGIDLASLIDFTGPVDDDLVSAVNGYLGAYREISGTIVATALGSF